MAKSPAHGMRHPKDNAPIPNKPFDSEARYDHDQVAVKANRDEGRPDDPTEDEPATARPSAARTPFKNLRSY